MWLGLSNKDFWAGLMLIAIGAAAVLIACSYPFGTALRMGTGYMPRLLCWLLLGLGAIVLAQGLRQQDAPLRSSPTATIPSTFATSWRTRGVTAFNSWARRK